MNTITPDEIQVMSDRHLQEGIFMHLQAQTESLQQIRNYLYLIAALMVLGVVFCIVLALSASA